MLLFQCGFYIPLFLICIRAFRNETLCFRIFAIINSIFAGKGQTGRGPSSTIHQSAAGNAPDLDVALPERRPTQKPPNPSSSHVPFIIRKPVPPGRNNCELTKNCAVLTFGLGALCRRFVSDWNSYCWFAVERDLGPQKTNECVIAQSQKTNYLCPCCS